MSMAQITLVGNLGRDPEMSYTTIGTAVTKFSLAVTRKRGDKEETQWFNCVAFRGLAEMLNQHLRKGQQVFVQGDLSARAYMNRDGQAAVSLEVIVNTFQFLGNKQGNGSGGKVERIDDDLGDLGDLDDDPF